MSAMREWLLENWRLKLMSLVFAVALWVFVTSGDRSESVLTVPLDLVDRPPGVEVTDVGVESVVVRVEGLRTALARLRSEDLRVEVSLRGARPGRFVAQIRTSDVTVPRGIRVVWLTPSQVRATLAAPPAG
jgi:YbbR domain-containing protein